MMPADAPVAQSFVRDVLLRDGSTLRLNTPTAADFEDIKVFYERLSDASRYFRFHGYGRTDTVARAEAEATGVDRLALIGRHRGEVVSTASYDGLRERGVAEVAFAVADRFQRRGIGTRMLEQLAEIAAERGIHRFDAEVMSENRPMLGVFENVGFVVRRRGSLGEVTVSLDITPTELSRERIGERDHSAAVAALRPILAPAAIAVVGANAAQGNIGAAVLASITDGDFQGVVAPVDPAGGVVRSRQAARTLSELPFTPELVIAAEGGAALVDLAAEAAESGARALLVMPGGLSDADEVSAEREEQLLEIVREAGLRLIGPSSLGVLNTAPNVSLNATFSGARVRAGGLAIGSHARVLGLGLLGHAAARDLGVSLFLSLGRRADVSTSDLLEWCAEDDRTAAAMLYVESFGDPRRFTRVAQRVSREKPILVVKGRHAHAPRNEARTQTAQALGGDAVFEAVLHAAGVLRFQSGEELFQTAELFESQPLPRGDQIAVLCNSPAAATVIVDACVARGLRLSASHPNPQILAVGASAADYAAAVSDLLGDPGVDAVIVSYVDHYQGDPEGVLNAISTAWSDAEKPLVASMVGNDGRLPTRARGSVPNFPFPESCAAALSRGVERSRWLSRPLGDRPTYSDLDPRTARELADAFLEREPHGGWLSLDEAQRLVGTHGIATARSSACPTVAEALAVAGELDGPIALKADLPAPHRASEIQALLVGVTGASAIRAGWSELEGRVRNAGHEWRGAIVQRLVDPGADVLVGSVTDPDLGCVVAVGPGGRQAGSVQAAAFRLPPTTDVEADELIDSCDSVAAELDSFAGQAGLDREALRELILRFALLLEHVPEIAEADLNTVRCMARGCAVLDMRLRLAQRVPANRVKTW